MIIIGKSISGNVVSKLTVASGTAFPATPSTGELFFRTDLNALHVYNNSAWVKSYEDITTTYLTGNETITLSGDATGSGNTAIAVTLPNITTAGTYTSMTVNAKGQVTAGTNPTTLAGYGITDAALNNHTHVAANITNTPSGNIASTDVQAAINELDVEKEPADATILKNADIGISVLAPTGDGSQLTGIATTATGKNYIINGGFDIWQRGTSGFANGYFADRWMINLGIAGISKNLTGSAQGFSSNAYINRDISGDASIEQRIESSSSIRLQGKNVTLQLNHTTASGSVTNIKVELYSANSVDNFTTSTLIESQSTTDSTTGTKSFSFSPLPTAVSNGLRVLITYTVVGNTFIRLTGVQLEQGSVATDFEYRSYGEELALCQRYFHKYASFSLGYTYSSNTATGGAFTFSTTMRVQPTISNALFSVGGGSAGTVAVASSTVSGLSLINGSANWAPGVPITLTAFIDAEI